LPADQAWRWLHTANEALDDRGRKDTLSLAVFAEIIAGGAQFLGERDVPAVV
jgi:hypothetical protein